MNIKSGTRVTLPSHDFLSDGVVIREIFGLGYLIKLDKKAPDTYVWDTDEVFMFPNEVFVLEEEES